VTCGEWEERIAAEMEDAAGHVAECGACREFASGLRWALSEAASAHGEEIAPAHYAAVRARVLAELRARRRWGWAWAAVGVCAVVMGVAVRDRMRVEELAIVVKAPEVVRPLAYARGSVRKPSKAEEIVVRIESPDVVIYWIAEAKGDE
jgi:hypothetical protein